MVTLHKVFQKSFRDLSCDLGKLNRGRALFAWWIRVRHYLKRLDCRIRCDNF